jgi:hypothetical protein
MQVKSYCYCRCVLIELQAVGLGRFDVHESSRIDTQERRIAAIVGKSHTFNIRRGITDSAAESTVL